MLHELCGVKGRSEQALFVVKMLNMYTKCVHIRVGAVLFIIASVFFHTSHGAKCTIVTRDSGRNESEHNHYSFIYQMHACTVLK